MSFDNFKNLKLGPLALLAIFVILTLFQNCSDVNLGSAFSEEPYVPPTFNLKTTVCPEARGIPGPSSKFIFIIDMSASNVGTWDRDVAVSGKEPLSYWDKTKATDPKGDRFTAVANFLDTCGSNSQSQFAIIGFSKTAGLITGSGTNSALSCSNVAFTDASTSKKNLANLKAAQDSDSAWFYQWDRAKGKYRTDPNLPPILGPTSYTSAFDCAKNITVSDLLTFGSNTTQNYHVTFISDGAPADANNSGCNLKSLSETEKAECHLTKSLNSVRIMRQSALSKGRDLRVHGVFYGPKPEIPSIMNALSLEGGTLEGTYLKSFEGNQNALCSLILTQSTIDYQPESLSLINLTTLTRNGKLYPDSDMDGLTDEEEVQMQSDPQNPRSIVPGILDVICKSLGGRDACLEKRLQTQCVPDQIVGFGLTDCDIKILGLDKIPGQIQLGIDADKDGIPDFIEIIKGTNPALADMTFDPDSDGLSNRDEIIKGTDPSTPDNIYNLLLNIVSTKYSPPSEGYCPYGGWSLNASRIQSKTNEELFNLPKDLDVLAHTKNQQVVLLLYNLMPTNASNPQSEYYFKALKINYSIKNGKESLESINEVIKPDEFTFMGKVKQ